MSRPTRRYEVVRTGGCLGERSPAVIADHETKAEAMGHARRLRRLLSRGERVYYRIRYHVRVAS